MRPRSLLRALPRSSWSAKALARDAGRVVDASRQGLDAVDHLRQGAGEELLLFLKDAQFRGHLLVLTVLRRGRYRSGGEPDGRRRRPRGAPPAGLGRASFGGLKTNRFTVMVRCLGRLLGRDHEVRPAVPGPRVVGVPAIERELVPVADGLDPRVGDAERDQVVLRGQRAPLAQREVVFGLCRARRSGPRW
jgi:hypothetical protein